MSTIHAAGQRKAPWLEALTAGGRERRRLSGPGDGPVPFPHQKAKGRILSAECTDARSRREQRGWTGARASAGPHQRGKTSPSRREAARREQVQRDNTVSDRALVPWLWGESIFLSGGSLLKKILIGTTNPSKVRRFDALLAGYDVEFCTLKDLGITEEPEEQGSTPAENAILKAAFYGKYFDTVICNDSGLYFDSLPMDDSRQPGLNVRTPNGRPRMNDEEMLQYYVQLVRSLGGKVLAYYLDGVAVYNHGTISSFMENSEATRQSAFYMVDKPAPERHEGWPLDSISLNRNTLTYFVREGNNQYDSQRENIMLGQYRERVIRFLAQALAL